MQHQQLGARQDGAFPSPRDGFEHAFDIHGLILAADPYESRPVLIIDCSSLEVVGGNSAVQHVFGRAADELKGLTPADLHVSVAKYRSFAGLVRSALQRGQKRLRCHYPLKRHDGSTFPAEVTITFVRDIVRDRMVYVCETRDLSNAAPVMEHHREGLDLKQLSARLPGALFQRIQTPDGEVQYAFLHGDLLQRLGISAASAQHNADVLMNCLHPDDRREVVAALNDSMRTLAVVDLNLRLFREDGRAFHVRSISKPRKLDDGCLIWDGILLDLTREHEAVLARHELVYVDELTGLPNVAGFRAALHESLEPRDEAFRPLAVAAINIKRLHLINQTYGVATTNEIIRSIGERLNSSVAGLALLARGQRGEFLVAIDAGEAGMPAEDVGEQLVDCFRQSFALADGSAVTLMPSVGVVVAPEHGRSVEELFFHLDAALNEARTKSTPSCAYYTESIVRRIRDALFLEHELRAAIKADRIKPHYQPQVDLVTGRVIGYEALARWTTDDGRVISPAQFIPLAEQTGLVGALGRSIVRQVADDIAAWRKHDRVPPVSVNISSRHLAEEAFDDWYLATLRDAGLDVDAICLEVTESTFLFDFGNASQQMCRLVDAGVCFSLDDFGTGYSSLSYLSRLPFRIVKIDRSFVTDIEHDRQKRALARSVMHIAAALELDVIAEGVETEAQRKVLADMGCKCAQGYLFGAAEPARVVKASLRNVD